MKLKKKKIKMRVNGKMRERKKNRMTLIEKLYDSNM